LRILSFIALLEGFELSLILPSCQADLATFRALPLDVYPEHPGKTVFLLAFLIQVFYHFLEDSAERYFQINR